MVSVENLTKSFKNTLAVNNLCMHINKGEIFGFVGANGAGKTTTMKIIAGLMAPNAGKVYIKGVDVSKNPLGVKRHIGYMPDFFGVYDDLKVTEYMRFYARLHDMPPGKIDGLTDSLLTLVRLNEKKHAYVDTLSRGMKQRLCLARSLIHDPEFLILDEPASGLDPRARIEMKEILKELKLLGKTVLISSHILPELSELCTSIGIIDNGRLVASGSVAGILDKLNASMRIKISVSRDVDCAAKALLELPEIKTLSSVGNDIEAVLKNISSDDEWKINELLSQILKSLIEKNIPVISYQPLQGSLESVFMHLTNKEE